MLTDIPLKINIQYPYELEYRIEVCKNELYSTYSGFKRR